ncbi:MAG: hypothetical protein KAS94_11375 [Desulfobulbaceae bacterium]|nr:hypothetical protein [Desulfobulbaceae bacterium]
MVGPLFELYLFWPGDSKQIPQQATDRQARGSNYGGEGRDGFPNWQGLTIADSSNRQFVG